MQYCKSHFIVWNVICNDAMEVWNGRCKFKIKAI